MIGKLTHSQSSIFQKDSSTKIWMAVIKKAECSKKTLILETEICEFEMSNAN